MVLTSSSLEYFLAIPYRIRVAMTESGSAYPYMYDEEPFFKAYNALKEIWVHRKSKVFVSQNLKISRDKIKEWEDMFLRYGTLGLLKNLSVIKVPSQLEKLVVLIKSARQHECASLALKLYPALDIPGASLKTIRHICRCYGYGQRLNAKDREYFSGLQHILSSIEVHKSKSVAYIRDKKNKAKTFFDFEHDPLQQRIELFKSISECEKGRQIRLILKKFGVNSNRYYELRDRYTRYGVWGIIDLIQITKRGEKISPELELEIIEQRVMDPSLSTHKMIDKLDLKCSRSNVQKVYSKWRLSQIKEPVSLRGVISRSVPAKVSNDSLQVKTSARLRFPNLIEDNNLKVNRCFSELVKCLSYKKVNINNPGALIGALFLDGLGVVEAIHTYGPKSFRSSEITNNIIVNVLRIIAGFPSIHDFVFNSDRSTAIGSGLSLNPKKSRFYDSLDELRFEHLEKLRNDAACQARELGLIYGNEIAVDYHCDQSDSRFPGDKKMSKAPDKNGNLVYAHRPQIIWDSITNTIINIAYCEGRSRAPSALYKFCENNLYKIISPDAINEIYCDSEYTGEKQIVYLFIRSESEVTMCLKQNPKIKKWKEETIKKGKWESYGEKYKIASLDFTLAETRKPFRFVVKVNIETNVTRCFGSTHIDYSAKKILATYHIRWPVETGIKELIKNYYLNLPTGTSPEKVETHYYCVMLAKLTIDYFRSVLCESKWRSPQDWECTLQTIRSSIFSNENCELSLNDSGDFLITYLDGDPLGIKLHLAQILEKRKTMGLNKVSWWGNRGLQIKVKDQFDFQETDVKSSYLN